MTSGCPESIRWVIPVVKSASAVGLVGGLRSPLLGQVTSTGLTTYFQLAVGAHVRARDFGRNFVAANVMLVGVLAVTKRFWSASENQGLAAGAAIGETICSFVAGFSQSGRGDNLGQTSAGRPVCLAGDERPDPRPAWVMQPTPCDVNGQRVPSCRGCRRRRLVARLRRVRMW